MNRKVLIVAYYFPPMGWSGVQRTTKFVKYLPDYGWEPTVLTVSPRGYYAYDESLLKDIERNEIKIVRTDSTDPLKLYKPGKSVKMPRETGRKLINRLSQSVFIPDNKIGWKRKAINTAMELCKREKFDVIFSTAPPFTDFLIGRDLKTTTRIPLILDYRDAWLEYQYSFYPTPMHRYAHYRLELSCVRATNKIVVVNRQIKINLLRRYTFIDYNNVHILPQGFDPDDFIYDVKKTKLKVKFMRITHTGTFLEDNSPLPLLKAIQKIFRDNPDMKGKIKLTFAGVFRNEHESVIKKLGLENDVEILGYIEHSDCTKLMMNSDLLFVTLGNKKDHLHHSTGKLFDYFGARKPILACVPEGVVKQTVKETGTGVVTDPDDHEKIAAVVMEFYEKFRRGKLNSVSTDKVNKFNRKYLTGELVKIFNSVLEN